MARRSSIADRIYQALQRLLPGEFRGDFGDDMRADFTDRRAGEGAVRAIRREAGPLIATAAREHLGILRRDVRDALRTMRRAPGFAALAILMLALGTGVNVAMFSIIDAVMLRTPFVDRERIATILTPVQSENGGTSWSAAVPLETFDRLATQPAFTAVGGLDVATHVLTGRGEPRRPDFECITPGLFPVLGTRPQFGRVFGEADDRPGAPPTVVLSHSFARELGDPATLVGTTVTLNRATVTVIGVMPRGFGGAYSRKRASGWLPAHVQLTDGVYEGCRVTRDLMAWARVREGTTLDQAMAATPGIRLTPIDDLTFGDRRRSFLILTVAVGCVLLIACLNVGGLQLERSLARSREFALRTALGASRARLIRHAITENLVLAMAGGGGAVAATSVALGAIVSLLPSNIPHLDEVAVNGRAMAAAFAIAALAGLVAGLAPVFDARRIDPARALAGSGRALTSRGAGTRRVFVVVEIALSVVVLIAAGLMIQTFATLRPSQPGFDPAQKLLTRVTLTGETEATAPVIAERLFDRLRQLRGVRAVEASTYVPLSGTTTSGAVIAGDTEQRAFTTSVVTPGYLETMKIPVRAGRVFTSADTIASPRVVVVNEAMALRLHPVGRVVGMRVRARAGRTPPQEVEIIGIVGSTRTLASNTDARPEFFMPMAQRPSAAVNMNLIVLTDRAHDPAMAEEIRAAIRGVLPDLPQEPVQLFEDVLNRGAATPRFGAWLLGVFAALAVTLAAIGLMTTMGWWVKQRTRELGVRIALGASRAQIMRMVMRQGLVIGATGIAAGAIAAGGVTRFLNGWIYGVTPLDPATFAGAIAVMIVVALISVCVPVRRALRVDPIVALRVE